MLITPHGLKETMTFSTSLEESAICKIPLDMLKICIRMILKCLERRVTITLLHKHSDQEKLRKCWKAFIIIIKLRTIEMWFRSTIYLIKRAHLPSVDTSIKVEKLFTASNWTIRADQRLPSLKETILLATLNQPIRFKRKLTEPTPNQGKLTVFIKKRSLLRDQATWTTPGPISTY